MLYLLGCRKNPAAKFSLAFQDLRKTVPIYRVTRLYPHLLEHYGHIIICLVRAMKETLIQGKASNDSG